MKQQQLDVLIDVPCFMCMFWKSERENQLLCKPAECQELTEWLEYIADIYEQNAKESARGSDHKCAPDLVEIDEQKPRLKNSRKKQ